MVPDSIASRPLVLVAEDNVDIRALIRVVLERAGLDVLEAADGLEALAALETSIPDVALLDVDMPGVSGYQVLEAMRASVTHVETPVLFVTARGTPGDVIEGLELGASDYLAKPFNARELVARVHAVLRAKAAADALRVSNALLLDAATRDGLTGIHNRRHLDQQLQSLSSVASRHHRSLSALMIDIDRFKLINDTYGHQVGDDVLRETASLFAGLARAEDIVGRYGGEEFLFLLPETDLEGAYRLGDRIRRAVEATAFRSAPGETIDVTVSVGCASCIGGDPGTLVANADRALYKAKAGGRNACRMAFPSEADPPETTLVPAVTSTGNL